MTPLFISKATSNLSEFTDFYTGALGALERRIRLGGGFDPRKGQRGGIRL